MVSSRLSTRYILPSCSYSMTFPFSAASVISAFIPSDTPYLSPIRMYLQFSSIFIPAAMPRFLSSGFWSSVISVKYKCTVTGIKPLSMAALVSLRAYSLLRFVSPRYGLHTYNKSFTRRHLLIFQRQFFTCCRWFFFSLPFVQIQKRSAFTAIIEITGHMEVIAVFPVFLHVFVVCRKQMLSAYLAIIAVKIPQLPRQCWVFAFLVLWLLCFPCRHVLSLRCRLYQSLLYCFKIQP